MKKVVTSMAALVAVSAGLVGCTTVPVGGAAVGPYPGTPVVGPSGSVVVTGDMFTGPQGYVIGRSLQPADRVYLENAVVTAPVNKAVTWTNPRTHYVYTVIPEREYYLHDRFYRRYQTRVYMNHTWHSYYGEVCHTPQGTWEVAHS